MTDPSASMQAALAFGEKHPSPSIRQYAGWARKIFAWCGLGPEQLVGTSADLDAYLKLAPQFDKHNAALVRRLIWKPATYKQYQKGGRLLIEHFTGELAARRARQAVADDTWALLTSGAAQLAGAGLVSPERLSGLAKIRDLSRARGVESTLVTADYVLALRTAVRSPKDWSDVVRGVALLDHLRAYPTLAAWLPAEPIGPIRLRWKPELALPPHLEAELAALLQRATTEFPDCLETEEARELLATELSKGARGVFTSAFRKYLQTRATLERDPGQMIVDLRDVGNLVEIFDEVTVAKVVVSWEQRSGRPGGLKPRTIYRYIVCIALTLARNGYPKAATTVANIGKSKSIVLEGQAAGERMSPKTQDWCRDLTADPEKIRLFETQHAAYARRARQALADAAAEGFDLVALADDPAQMAKLCRAERRRAKALLRRARMFGVCAAYAAISLEGAPFRQENTLGLMMSGTAATFFDHSHPHDPHFRIVIPNELLKNGQHLTMRGQTLPPIVMRRNGPNDLALPILRFYIDRIRPLFPRHKSTSALFPSLDCAGTHLCNKTFGNWLLECSTEIGLPLTSHNFRHGRCTIEINDDPACIDRLAAYLGDKPGTIRKYYAFLNVEAIVDRLQSHVASRRAAYCAGRSLAAELAA